MCLYLLSSEAVKVGNEHMHVSMDEFANQTEDFMANWIKENGLEKLVDILKGMTVKVFDTCVEIFIYQFIYMLIFPSPQAIWPIFNKLVCPRARQL